MPPYPHYHLGCCPCHPALVIPLLWYISICIYFTGRPHYSNNFLTYKYKAWFCFRIRPTNPTNLKVLKISMGKWVLPKKGQSKECACVRGEQVPEKLCLILEEESKWYGGKTGQARAHKCIDLSNANPFVIYTCLPPQC